MTTRKQVVALLYVATGAFLLLTWLGGKQGTGYAAASMAAASVATYLLFRNEQVAPTNFARVVIATLYAAAGMLLMFTFVGGVEAVTYTFFAALATSVATYLFFREEQTAAPARSRRGECADQVETDN